MQTKASFQIFSYLNWVNINSNLILSRYPEKEAEVTVKWGWSNYLVMTISELNNAVIVMLPFS